LLIIGTGIFPAGALGFIAGYLSQGVTSMLGALSLIPEIIFIKANNWQDSYIR